MGRGKRTKGRGCFCWVCERLRPSERFAAKGRQRHVCRDCARLGPDELAFRQCLRNMQGCLTLDGRVRRGRRAAFERFLGHEDARVRGAAEQILRAEVERRSGRLATANPAGERSSGARVWVPSERDPWGDEPWGEPPTGEGPWCLVHDVDGPVDVT